MKTTNTKYGLFGVLIGMLFLFPLIMKAQYFGRNKPGYRIFDYKVYESPHFEIYHYLDNKDMLDELTATSEKWYKRHKRVFLDTFEQANPLIFYNTHADFQQTNAISQMVGVTTGGVTEVLKNRMILPIGPTRAQSNHVIGHEMVHAFQFHKILSADSTSMGSLRNLPLWMVEGMAEYFSIGGTSPHTAMWMRDALIQEDFPTIKEMTRSNRYFPYRFGHSLMAMIGKTWGDDKIVPLFMATAKYGYEAAFDSILGHDPETVSNMWKNALLTGWSDYLEEKNEFVVGQRIIHKDKGGRVNVSPAVSPDGKYVVFLSEKNVFTYDLYLANAKTGKLLKKLTSTVHNNEIDAMNYFESSGTWSPDSKKFAYVVFKKGLNRIIILDVEKKKKLDEITVPGVPSINHPAWSPDGKQIVFSGLKQGQNDLYAYSVESGKVEQLTDDIYSDIHPAWSSNGQHIVFSSDRGHQGSYDYHENVKYNLAVFDVNSREITVLPVFRGADNINPIYAPDNNSIYFLSDRDGFRNLYQYFPETGEMFQKTDILTGICGITMLSPAISIAREQDRLIFSYYTDRSYAIYSAESQELHNIKVPANEVNQNPAVLPPMFHVGENIVDQGLKKEELSQPAPETTYDREPYQPKFKLDYISNTNVGVATSRFGTGMAGSVNAIFSDIVGNNQMYTSLSVNGEIYDIGGQVAYINRKRNLDWGASYSHIPYRYATYSAKLDTLELEEGSVLVNNLILDYMRVFEDKVSVFGFYPFSKNRRIEAGFSHAWYYYRFERIENYYTDYGQKIGENREKLDAPDGFTLQKIDMAHVTDNSFFGIASPSLGSRSRVQVERYFGKYAYYAALADYRKYFFFKPLTLALRAYHYGRYGGGKDAQNLSPLYLGYPWYVHGYGGQTYYRQQTIQEGDLSVNQLKGSRLVVANVELRLPFSGPKRLALIKSKYFLTELALFFDAGLAWNSDHTVSFDWQTDSADTHIPVYSSGVSLRINLFGAMVLEPYYAIPFQRGGIENGTFGLNFIPGW